MNCKRCGNLLTNDTKFCTNCGEKISEEIQNNINNQPPKNEKKK